MKKIVVASMNPVKCQVAELASRQVFKESVLCRGIAVDSKVPSQPFNGQVLNGAHNRLLAARAADQEADIWISMEGGIFNDVHDGNKLFNQAWILATDKSGFIAKSLTASFLIPTRVAALVLAGKDLAAATDEVFCTENCNESKGCIHFVTDRLISRMELYLPSVIIALTQLKHKEWYS